jgi:pyruvate/2-oxoglutarate dehydrogenase complex dihydrolipoamide dehydrogenase (E3) component
MKTFDAIVIGSGQGGTPLSKKLAKAGWKTALIEKKFIGGTCINVGCTPTKTMVASARLAYLASKARNLGVHIPSATVDLGAVVQRKNDVVQQFRNGAKTGLEKTENLTLFFGEASFTGIKELQVKLNDGSIESLAAEYIFIDTGGTAIIPAIDGIDTVPYLTSSSILDVTEVPQHLLIIGASYIGCEFGQMFKRFGSKVTMLEHSSDFLSREDRDVAGCLQAIFEEEGIIIETKATLQKVAKAENSIKATATIDEKEQQIECTHILLAIGRAPQTKQLQLEKTAVETDHLGFIKVNEKLQTTTPGIFALGDVKGGPAFTHISYNDYVVIEKNLLQKADVSIAARPVPYCMFTDPQLARVGISEDEARKKGLNHKVATLSMEKVARAIETGETRGMMKAIVDTETKQILGATIIGEQGGEIMSMLEIAMVGNMTYDKIKDMVFAHPLYAESLNNLFLQLD